MTTSVQETKRGETGSAVIEAEELARRLERDADLVVVDCRFDLANPDAGAAAYAAGHIPGARYAHLDRDLSRPPAAHEGRHPLPDPHVFARRLGELGISPSSFVVAYDGGSGAIAARLWWMLRWLGHGLGHEQGQGHERERGQGRERGGDHRDHATEHEHGREREHWRRHQQGHAAILNGGFERWRSLDLPIEQEIPTPAPARYDVEHLHEDWVVDAAAAAAAARTGLLVDARGAPRFRGENEPIDPVAGHVPGAVNHPFTESLGADGRLLEPAVLRRNLEALLDGREASGLVAMCGSGVTACHLLWTMEAAGLGPGKLYAGSWSEWIRDPARPVATGD
jgi:thiosulfate/3-mercaptopyruvate sulfurtransferase